MEKNSKKAVDKYYNNMSVNALFVIDLIDYINDNFVYDCHAYYYKEESMGMYPVDAELIIKDFLIFKYGL